MNQNFTPFRRSLYVKFIVNSSYSIYQFIMVLLQMLAAKTSVSAPFFTHKLRNIAMPFAGINNYIAKVKTEPFKLATLNK